MHKERPIVWLAIAYGAGTAASTYFSLPLWVAVAPLVPAVLWVWWRPPSEFGPALTAGLSGLLLGCVSCAMVGEPATPEGWGYAPGDYAAIDGRVVKPYVPGEFHDSFIMDVDRLWDESGMPRTVRGRAVVIGEQPGGLPAGQRVRAVGELGAVREPLNPGEFDLGTFNRRRYGTGVKLEADQISRLAVAEPSRTSRLASFRYDLHGRLLDCMPRANPTLTTDILLSTVIGLRSVDIPDALVEDFQRAGTIHVLVVSGSQVAIITALVMGLSLRAGRLRWIMMTLCIPIVFCYALIVGSEPSITRAALMGGLAALAFTWRREYDVMAALATAAFLIMLHDPAAVFDAGFQLSVACVLAIIHFIPGRDRVLKPGHVPVELNRRPTTPLGYVWLATRVSFAIWLLVTPLLLRHFGEASLVSPIANLAAVPLAAGLMVLGILASALVWIAPFLAYLVNYLNSLMVEGLVRTTSTLAHVPMATWKPGAFSWAAVGLWWVVVFGLDALIRRARTVRVLKPGDD